MSAEPEEKIKALAVFEAGGKVQAWEYVPMPLAEDEVEIEVEACGVCHSDLNAQQDFWEGTHYPLVVGHEVIGTVSKLGSSVEHLKLGDRVGVSPQSGCCGACHFCADGRENYCKEILFNYDSETRLPRVQPHTYGGFAEKTRVQAKWAFPIPDALDSVTAAPLLCAGITTWQPLVDHVKPGQRVGVLGIGGLGHIGLQFARKLGCHTVAISRSAGKAEEAQRFGAHEVLVTEDAEQLKRFERSLDFILATVSANNADWNLYLGLLAQRGRVLLVGIPNEMSLDPRILVNRGLAVEGSLLAGNAEIRRMLEFCAEHGVVALAESLPMTPEGANEALEKIERNEPRYRMVLVNHKHPNNAHRKE